MRKITHYLVWLFVFTVPLDVIAVPLAGSISRLVGLVAIATAALTTVIGMRFRKPDPILGFAILFAVWSGLSLLWTMSFEATIVRAFTYAQLAASVWMVREFVRTQTQLESLLIAYCLGSVVPMVSLFRNFTEKAGTLERFTASGVNANNLGVVLVLGIPMAWYLILRRGGPVRLMAVAYFALAPLAILLTGTRGSYLAGVVALAIVPTTLPRQSWRSYGLATALLIFAVIASVSLVPQSIWTRVASIKSEILEGGQMTGRREIWKAGLQVFPQHPILGVGAGSYGIAVQRVANKTTTVSHSTPLAVLVEEGLVGLGIFVGLLGACAWTIVQLQKPERILWGVVLLTWVVGTASLNWEAAKGSWLLFGFVASQGGIRWAEGRAAFARRRTSGAVPVEADRPKQWARA